MANQLSTGKRFLSLLIPQHTTAIFQILSLLERWPHMATMARLKTNMLPELMPLGSLVKPKPCQTTLDEALGSGILAVGTLVVFVR